MDTPQSFTEAELDELGVNDPKPIFLPSVFDGFPPKPLIGLAAADQWIGFNAAGYGFIMRWQHEPEAWACIGLQRMPDGRDYPAAFLLDVNGKDDAGIAPIIKHIVLDSSVLRETKQ